MSNLKTTNQQWRIKRYEADQFTEMDDEIAVEMAMTIVVNGEEYATMVCSPCQLEQLVIGFLASEGFIRTYGEIVNLQVDDERGFAYVELTKQLPPEAQTRTKRFIGSCCGKSREFYFQQDMRTARTIINKETISVDAIFGLMKAFQRCSDDYKRTGGVHEAALADGSGLMYQAVDIGRHNALDKVSGYMMRDRITSRNKQIVFSGRVSSEVLLKVSKMGIGFIISPSAPTHLALKLAEDLNITVIGFVRHERMNVYTKSQYVLLD
ncbi:formate dehydrogenase accessory sulfurtransferase FdhD [Pontibacillus litoralis]|uniref:Sulfur carrier protein FdhD n=1 Tax=Pontibacillus litoralis JSM 072002 TaxID=1385512 RepID=A0A0A5G1V0_9BACI|nr:formate dehydrogenase accessory sulfurtransferase FdhD [Pontibacillus litoralis]KGX85118.1 formate dehydrogenase subunit D [Pontibacillus litoralis JSM 072002]